MIWLIAIYLGFGLAFAATSFLWYTWTPSRDGRGRIYVRIVKSLALGLVWPFALFDYVSKVM